MKNSLLVLSLIFLIFNMSCKKSPTSSSANTAPIASFTITPSSGTEDTVFDFDASSSSDIDDENTILQVRWDWENDGIYDTNYNTNKTASHQYSTIGTITIKLEVIDSGELTNTTTKIITVSPGTGTVTDIDGNVYNTIQICNQLWMVENLKVTHYRNGDAIANVTDNTEWINLTTGAYCSYNNDDSNIDKYGLLYNWYVVDKIAPIGWHIPSDNEWKELERCLGMSQSGIDSIGWRGTDEGSKLKSPNEWSNSNNESGFSALPSGYRRANEGHFRDLGTRTLYWMSNDYDGAFAWLRALHDTDSQINRFNYYKQYGYSLRCIKD